MGDGGVVADAAAPSLPVWRGIVALGEAVGRYCWLERRLFELTGGWATATGDGAASAEARVFLAAASRRHGSLAERWAARLPVRAGIDPSALILEPPDLPGEVADQLSDPAGASGARDHLGALVEVLLPWVAGQYETDLAAASPVCEGPVMEVLVAARRAAVGEIRGGLRLLEHASMRPG